jgi:uncharacterized protein involved in propanediol utilization
VSEECLAYGMNTKSSGVWGGITLDRGNNRRRKKSTNQQQKEETK